jgi:hypothetical protein
MHSCMTRCARNKNWEDGVLCLTAFFLCRQRALCRRHAPDPDFADFGFTARLRGSLPHSTPPAEGGASTPRLAEHLGQMVPAPLEALS